MYLNNVNLYLKTPPFFFLLFISITLQKPHFLLFTMIWRK